MTTNRREFLKIAGVSALTLILPQPWVAPQVVAAARSDAPRQSLSTPGASPALTAKCWAMAVDTAKCPASCTECIDACHTVHNVPDFGRSKHEVKWIWREDFPRIFPEANHAYLPKAVRSMRPLVLCNHCANPPCVRVCPTKATFQRANGIVMMDYHRCIGCRLCMAACPYGARSMNYRDPRPFIGDIHPDYPTRTRGVVEKCNFCEERLVRGLMPACVLACREKALVFGDVENPQSEIRLLLEKRFNLRRRAGLGTKPQIYYLL
jgi:molybdopterin-containing oxidoreductase family iron-sulfur binding subunit